MNWISSMLIYGNLQFLRISFNVLLPMLEIQLSFAKWFDLCHNGSFAFAKETSFLWQPDTSPCHQFLRKDRDVITQTIKMIWAQIALTSMNLSLKLIN